ncbi:MAG TPA: hypothetical protein GX497_13325 [Bacillus bacterium]|nr:hypothetical protein [Bacillus sp. (in: firmicutes)]
MSDKILISVPSVGYFQFVRNIFFYLIDCYDVNKLYLGVPNEDVIIELRKYNNRLKDWEQFIFLKELEDANIKKDVILYITPEQYNLGIDGIYSICCFHGPSAKGVTFNQKILETFDAFFMIGPLHKDTLFEYLEENGVNLPNHLDLYDIGYPKSDDVINGLFNKIETIERLSLDIEKPTLLYAPAFNEHSSLRDQGEEIIKALCNSGKYNVIAKLPIDCHQPIDNFYATGGVDWFAYLSKLSNQYSNFRVVHDYDIDEYLWCSDILITCVSSVGFEFLALNKPVIFIDAPKFFDVYLKRIFPYQDTSSWKNQLTKNGGRQFGTIVSDVSKLESTVTEILINKDQYPKNREDLDKLLFNKGESTIIAVETIKKIALSNKLCSRKPSNAHFFGEVFLKRYNEIFNKSNVVIFGASTFGEITLNFLKEKSFNHLNFMNCFVDNDSKKWGNTIENYLINSPSILEDNSIDMIIIASIHYKEILKQLNELNIGENIEVLVSSL